MKRITFELPSDLYKDAKVYSIQNDMTLKEVLGMALFTFLKKGAVSEITLRQLLREIFQEK